MGELNDDTKVQIVLVCVVVVLVFFVSFCFSLILCCLMKRRTTLQRKVFIRLNPPRPSFCTFISNNTPYQRVLEEYGDKMIEMQHADLPTNTKHKHKRNPSSGSSGKRRKSDDKVIPQYATSVEFPQWNNSSGKKAVKTIPTQYSL